jgi:hypothetical protein
MPSTLMQRLAIILVLLSAPTVFAAEPDRQGLDFFEAKIRPMLVTHCYECHSAAAVTKNKLKGGLYLDSREGSRLGGESGPAVVPGDVEASLLIAALRHDSLEMPPKGKLPDELISHFVKWIEIGAPDPRDSSTVASSNELDIELGRQHWSFQPLSSGNVPTVQDHAWIRNPVDPFVRARQEAAGVTPNQLADPRTLIRRATFDLLGLPPTPEEVEEFIADSATDPYAAYCRLIDRLLEKEQYGERWARHWLDVTRFAESNGYAFDGDRPNAWHYRDFVIRSLNADMPYDEFIRLQLCGDLLTDVNVGTTDESKTAQSNLAATGYIVAGPYTTQQTQKERERSRYEQLDDIVSTLGTSILGLTVGCSRCHSHKFDPLPQHDYYRLAACFADVGFSDTGINSEPETFIAAKAEYDKGLLPLVDARAQFEKETLTAAYTAWLASTAGTKATPTPETFQLEPWQHIGPFPDVSFDQAFDTTFAPEASIDLAQTYLDGKLQWTPQPEWKDATVHNTFTGGNAANYIYRVIQASDEQTLQLSLGSDDAIKLWVNGEIALSKKVGRGAAADQETIQINLRKGRNELLMKIVNGAGPSGFYFSATAASNVALQSPGTWVHVGPFPAADLNAAYDTVFPPELEINLEQTFEEGKLKWTPQPDWQDAVAHNDKITGANSANYLYRVIESEKPQVVKLSLGSDDGIKLWVNGREVLAKKVGRNVAAADQESAVIQLAAGRNELLLKIANGGGASGFYYAATQAAATAEITAIMAVAAEKRDANQNQKLIDWYKGFDLGWLALNQTVARHQTKVPLPKNVNVFAARVRGTSYQFGEDSYKVYHLRRGNVNNKQELAEAGFLQVLMPTEQQSDTWLALEEPGSRQAARLGLAQWIADTDRGAGHLAARVIVNRLWYYHFGRGIVATPSDFGTRGERPSHPELLDWLASELIRSDWKLKPIHRLIMTSAAYSQAGESTESGRLKDPENLLLWRRNAKRLEAESIRDTLLSVCGVLDSTMFGSGTLDERSKRRSIYFTVKRSRLNPLLKLFDAPDAMQGIATREESTVAPQALALMNSPIVREFAGTFAERCRPSANTPMAEAIDRAYQFAFSRTVSEEESNAMLIFVQQQMDARKGDANAEALAIRDLCHLLLCMNEFIYID